MSGVAAAIVGTGVVAAGATIASGAMSAGATKDASNAAITEQQAALQQQAQLSQPYRDLGTNNIQTYQNLLTGQGTGSAPGTAAPGSAAAGANIENTLQSMPGYKATLATGTEAAERSAAASGLNLSGNQVAGVEQYGAQLADSTYQQQLNDALQPIQIGQAAAAGQAANVGTSANNISNALINQGNNQANIDANTVAGITKAGSNATNQYLTYNTLQGLNNPGGGGGGSPYTYNPGAVTGIGQPAQDPYAMVST
jgi:hypothetical protein